MRDLSMPITFGSRSSITFFSTCHWSSPQSSAWCCPTPGLAATSFVARTAWYTPPCEPPPSAIRSTPFAGAAIEEDVDRPPPRREGRRRHDRREHRILVVLAHRHDPHVDPVRAHERRQHEVHPLLQPSLLDLGLLAEGAEGTWRRLRRDGERDESGQQQDANAAHAYSVGSRGAEAGNWGAVRGAASDSRVYYRYRGTRLRR